jgi:hypothetical protein
VWARLSNLWGEILEQGQTNDNPRYIIRYVEHLKIKRKNIFSFLKNVKKS